MATEAKVVYGVTSSCCKAGRAHLLAACTCHVLTSCCYCNNHLCLHLKVHWWESWWPFKLHLLLLGWDITCSCNVHSEYWLLLLRWAEKSSTFHAMWIRFVCIYYLQWFLQEILFCKHFLASSWKQQESCNSCLLYHKDKCMWWPECWVPACCHALHFVWFGFLNKKKL